MQHTLNALPPGALDLEVNPTFNVVIAYEDFETGKHARRTYDFLVEQLGGDCQFANQMWKFDVLRIPKLREMAVKDAVTADVIIVSARGGSELPADVRHWIDAWLAGPRNAIALVALFDSPREQTADVRAYLAGAARRGNMAFFAQPDEWPGRQSGDEPLMGTSGRGGDPKTMATIAGAVQRDLTLPQWEGS